METGHFNEFNAAAVVTGKTPAAYDALAARLETELDALIDGLRAATCRALAELRALPGNSDSVAATVELAARADYYDTQRWELARIKTAFVCKLRDYQYATLPAVPAFGLWRVVALVNTIESFAKAEWLVPSRDTTRWEQAVLAGRDAVMIAAVREVHEQLMIGAQNLRRGVES